MWMKSQEDEVMSNQTKQCSIQAAAMKVQIFESKNTSYWQSSIFFARCGALTSANYNEAE